MQEYLAKCLNILHVVKNSLKKSVSRGECTYLYISNSASVLKMGKNSAIKSIAFLKKFLHSLQVPSIETPKKFKNVNFYWLSALCDFHKLHLFFRF